MVSGAHWARLRFGGTGQRWHIVVGVEAICGRLSFDYPRVDRREAKPESGKLCKFCEAKENTDAKAEAIPRLRRAGPGRQGGPCVMLAEFTRAGKVYQFTAPGEGIPPDRPPKSVRIPFQPCPLKPPFLLELEWQGTDEIRAIELYKPVKEIR